MDGDLQRVMLLPISHLQASGDQDIVCCCYRRKPDSTLIVLCNHRAVSPEKLDLFFLFKWAQNGKCEMCLRVMNFCYVELKMWLVKVKNITQSKLSYHLIIIIVVENEQ